MLLVMASPQLSRVTNGSRRQRATGLCSEGCCLALATVAGATTGCTSDPCRNVDGPGNYSPGAVCRAVRLRPLLKARSGYAGVTAARPMMGAVGGWVARLPLNRWLEKSKMPPSLPAMR